MRDDGFTRLSQTNYPTPANGAVSSTTDYEQYAYDPDSRIVQDRRRDGSLTTTAYDALGRIVTGPRGESFTYDLMGRMLTTSLAGITDSFTYDGLGHKLTESGPTGTLAFQYDAAGRRTRTTWGDGLYLSFAYDAADDLESVGENGATAGPGLLATFTYDNLGRQTGVARGNGVSSAFGYDGASRLTSLTHSSADQPATITLTRGANGQIDQRSLTNAAYATPAPSPSVRNATANGLDQIAQQSVNGGTAVPVAYDGRGNLTNDGAHSYGYDVENNLNSRDGAAASLAYDGRGRLASVAGTATTQFAYDEGRVVGEFDAANTLLRRYVPEAGVWYEGSGVSDRRWMLADERGSIMAVTNGAGTTATIDTYDEYGVPGAANAGRFQYTGQMWIAELGLYHYNARAYSPALGRFMQSDPIGYKDGPNWYEYVGDDPVDKSDPTGNDAYVAVSDNGQIKIVIPIEFSGDAATPGNISEVTNNIASTWSGIFGPYNVTTSVQVINPGQSNAPSVVNRSTITDGPTDKNGGHSYVSNASDMHITMADVKGQGLPTGNPNEFSTSINGSNTPGHGAGHLMGLPDVKGSSGGIMDGGRGAKVTGTDIKNIIDSPVNILKPPPPCTPLTGVCN